MSDKERQNLIDIIVKREKLRPLGRLTRLFRDPLRAFPYYLLATASHIKPFKISFKTLWGDTMTGYLPEANTFYYYGYCEANLTSFLLRFLKEGSTFIDVGAHIGFYSMLASHLVGEKGKVYSFEPTSWTFKLLQKNTFDMKNVSIFNLGASDTEEEISFSDYGPGYGAYNSASKEGTMLTFQPKITNVKMISIDSFFKKENLLPDFIKLDAEGFEYKILKGLSETLRTMRPIITLEMAGDKKWSENRRISTEILLGAQYESYRMTDDGFIEGCDIKTSYTYTNILFVPKEKNGLVKHLIQ